MRHIHCPFCELSMYLSGWHLLYVIVEWSLIKNIVINIDFIKSFACDVLMNIKMGTKAKKSVRSLWVVWLPIYMSNRFYHSKRQQAKRVIISIIGSVLLFRQFLFHSFHSKRCTWKWDTTRDFVFTSRAMHQRNKEYILWMLKSHNNEIMVWYWLCSSNWGFRLND